MLILLWRRGSGSNRRIKVLQTFALPLGYRADQGKVHLQNTAPRPLKSIRPAALAWYAWYAGRYSCRKATVGSTRVARRAGR